MLAGAIIGHFIGDFLFQNDFLAKGKKKKSWICALHCLIWTLCVVAGMYVEYVSQEPHVRAVYSFDWLMFAYVWLFGTHFLIDRTAFVPWWMDNISGQSGFKKNLGPWSVIIVDQVFHLLTILLIFTVFRF